MKIVAIVVLALPAFAAGIVPAWHGLESPPGVASSRSSQEREFRWEGRLAGGQEIEVVGVNGEVRASAAPGETVVVRAVKRARRSDPETVRIEVVQHADGVTICALYPSKKGGPNECQPGGATQNRVEDNDVRVDFTVQVPSGVGFVGRTVNGGIAATGLRGTVEAYTVNGGVEVGSSESASAETVNGSITASVGRGDWSGPLDFHTVNGGIALRLPRQLDAEIQAETVNGEIATDYPMTVQGRFGPKRLSGTVGRGGRSINLQTVNGDIELRAAS